MVFLFSHYNYRNGHVVWDKTSPSQHDLSAYNVFLKLAIHHIKENIREGYLDICDVLGFEHELVIYVKEEDGFYKYERSIPSWILFD